MEKNTCFITMDLQKTMPLPKLPTSKAFYLRQMWFDNYVNHFVTATDAKLYFFNQTEDVANRGNIEIASCLFRFCQQLKETTNIDNLIIWSYSCAGQNKNKNIISLYKLLVSNGTFKAIDHKFPEVVHSYTVSEQYLELRSTKTKNCVTFDMENYFYKFDELSGKLHIWNKKLMSLDKKSVSEMPSGFELMNSAAIFIKKILMHIPHFIKWNFKKKEVG